MSEIVLPYEWQPRNYQMQLWGYLEGGGKRAVAVWHRRAGKDDVCLHWTATSMVQRVGTYWHMLPEASQARKAVWDAVNPHTAKRRIDEVFPEALRDTKRDNDMMIRLLNGSTWQVIGSDNYNSLVGSPPIGVVLSEWALADPAAWAYLRPILAENGGWALFISTPRGRNHLSTFYQNALQSEGWFAESLPATETTVFTEKQLADERAEYISEFGAVEGEARFEQEYLCSFDAPVIGSYFGKLMNDAEKDGRITNVPYQKELQVQTWWDIGIGDSTSIWFVQVAGQEIHVIDYYENSGEGLAHYAKVLQDKGYIFADHIGPHDLQARELGTGKTRIETALGLGLRFRVAPNERVADGIEAARNLIPRCWFDAEKCRQGIEALRQYRKEWNDKNKVFHDRPLHDWTSHAADAFRYGAMMFRKPGKSGPINYPKQSGVI